MSDPLTWTTSGNYAAGCKGTSCRFATDCNNHMITYDDGAKGSCGSATCVTMTIFQSPPFASPSASNIFCALGWTANTISRELQVTTTESSSSPSVSRQSMITLSTIQTTATSQTLRTPGPTSIEKASSSNGAWIAGAVIGPIAGVVIVALIAWLTYRRKQKKASISQEQLVVGGGNAQLPGSSVSYTWASQKGAHELDAAPTPRVYELASSDYK